MSRNRQAGWRLALREGWNGGKPLGEPRILVELVPNYVPLCVNYQGMHGRAGNSVARWKWAPPPIPWGYFHEPAVRARLGIKDHHD